MVIYGIVMKGRSIIIPMSLQERALEQLHVNHMDIEKTRFLACQSIYGNNISADIENAINTVM